MKKFILSFSLMAMLLMGKMAAAQLTIGADTRIRSDNNSYIVLHDLGIVHNAVVIEPVVKFTGNTTVLINSNGIPVFSRIEVANSRGTSVKLEKDIEVSGHIRFSGGMLNLNGRTINLQTTALLLNESESSRVNSPAGGEISVNVLLNAPVAANPGNLGVLITSAANMGNVKVSRGHKPFLMNANNQYSIARYYTITPANNQNLNATLRIQYLDTELNGRSEELLGLWRSDNGGNSFQSQEFTGRSTGQNYVEKSGIGSLATHTLFDAQAILPVTNWQFVARRINSNLVKLDWTTMQESSNRGFHIERQLEQEAGFSPIGFVTSLAPGGNSNRPLTYAQTDNNSYNGKTYYRLRQEDLDGHFAFSVIRMVTREASKDIVLKAWPIPAQGHFFVSVEGVDKDLLQIFDVAGKLKQELLITGNTQHQVSHLPAGMYVLRLASQKGIQQKVVVQ